MATYGAQDGRSGKYKGHSWEVLYNPIRNNFTVLVDGVFVVEHTTPSGGVNAAMRRIDEMEAKQGARIDRASIQDRDTYRTFQDTDGTFGFQARGTGLIKTGYRDRGAAASAARAAVEADAKARLRGLGLDPAGRATEQLLGVYQHRAREIFGRAEQEAGRTFREFMERGGYEDKRAELGRAVADGLIDEEQSARALQAWYAQYERSHNLHGILADAVVGAEREAMDALNGQLADAYRVNHEFGMYQIEQGVRAAGAWGLPDRATVQRLLRDGNLELVREVEPKVPKAYAWSRQKFNSAIEQGILQGEGVPKIVRRVRSVVGMDRASAERAARTALTNAQNAGRVDAYRRAQGMGVEVEMEWQATLDSRTRISHRHLMGERAPVGGTFSNGLRFPGDPEGAGKEVYNCRCTLLPYIPGIDYSRSEDWFRSREIEGMSFEEWLEGKSPEHRALAGEEHTFAAPAVPDFQRKLAQCSMTSEVADLMAGQGWFKKTATGRDPKVDLTGVDLPAAKQVAAAYDRIYTEFPQLVGQFHAPDSSVRSPNTYASCTMSSGWVHLNPSDKFFGNWDECTKTYERDVVANWHPKGTSAESVVVHELGHAIDGWMRNFTYTDAYRSANWDGGLTREWGDPNAAGGKGRYSFSTAMRERVMKAATGRRWTKQAVRDEVSDYAAENATEWMAECFAEYISSADPRRVASKFGEELRRMMAERDRIKAEHAQAMAAMQGGSK